MGNKTFSKSELMRENTYKTHFAFIFSHIQSEENLPFSISDNVAFRRASELEAGEICKLLNFKGGMGPPSVLPYGTKQIKVPNKKGTGYTVNREALSPDVWKYFVIEFPRDERYFPRYEALRKACSILNNDLEIAFNYYLETEEGGLREMGYSNIPTQMFNQIRNRSPEYADGDPREITHSDLGQLRDLFCGIKGLASDEDLPNRALQNYLNILELPKHSDLLIIGYFSIIELLVTHSPREKEMLDSISNQIAYKMILLFKLMDSPINLGNFEGDPKPQKLWKKLYQYRSQIAHGGKPSFDKGELSCLKSKNNVSQFLKEVVKGLLRYSIKNHDFLEDLKRI